MTRAVDGAAVVIGHLPAGLRPGGLGQLRVPAIERKAQPKPRQLVTSGQERAMPTAGDTCEIAESERLYNRFSGAEWQHADCLILRGIWARGRAPGYAARHHHRYHRGLAALPARSWLWGLLAARY